MKENGETRHKLKNENITASIDIKQYRRRQFAYQRMIVLMR